MTTTTTHQQAYYKIVTFGFSGDGRVYRSMEAAERGARRLCGDDDVRLANCRVYAYATRSHARAGDISDQVGKGTGRIA